MPERSWAYAVLVFLICGGTLAVGKPRDNRIINGRLANVGEFPYQVSLRRSYNDRHSCGGSIVTRRHILTAAHCMFYAWGGLLPPIVVSMVFGQLDLDISPRTIYRNASKITVHPAYDPDTMANDLAVVEFKQELPDDQKLMRAIPLNDNCSFWGENLECIVSGWGVQRFDSLAVSEKLLATQVLLMSHEECQRRYGKLNVTLVPGMLCANDEKNWSDACQGDSGGPLACDGRLVGVISTGNGCGNPEFPGIYSNVEFFLPWIKSVVLNDDSSAELDDFDSSSEEDDTYSTIVIETTTEQKIQSWAEKLSQWFNSAVSTILAQFQKSAEITTTNGSNCVCVNGFLITICVTALLGSIK